MEKYLWVEQHRPKNPRYAGQGKDGNHQNRANRRIGDSLAPFLERALGRHLKEMTK